MKIRQIAVWVICTLLAVAVSKVANLDALLAFLNGMFFGAIAWALCSLTD